MSLYSKWQRLNAVQIMTDFVFGTPDSTLSRGGILLVCIGAYFLLLLLTVKVLRAESIKEDH